MKRAWIPALLCALAFAVPARAGEPGDPVEEPVTSARVPNFLGATGLLSQPSAHVQRRDTGSVFLAGTSAFFGGGAVVGLGDRLELGFSVLDFDAGAGDDTEFILNGKFLLVEETENVPAVAIGAIDILDELNVDPTWYIVASKYFTRSEIEQRFALKGHLGFGGGLFDEEFFVGAELFFDPNLSAMAEYFDDDFNVGARYTSRGFAATLALFDLDRFGGSLSYTATFR